MIDCRAAMAVMWDYIDGELPREQVEAVREHLAMCKRCYPHYAFEIAFLEALASLRDAMPLPSPALRQRVRDVVASSH